MSSFIFEPSPESVEAANLTGFMRKRGFGELSKFLTWSVDHLEDFWRESVAACSIDWFTPYTQIVDGSKGPEWSTWFAGGELNIAHNCLDRHQGTAIVWENEAGETRTVTFEELRRMADGVAARLLALGMNRGDRVALVMPMVPEVVAILYGCFTVGLVIVPIFSGFGEHAIWKRLSDSGARVVFTADHLVRRGKQVPLRSKVEQALRRGTAVEHILEWGDTPEERAPAPVVTMRLPGEATAFILYTSGTTGKPKGTVHTHAGCLAQMSKEIYFAFDHKPGDRFFWLADIGWMMGPWTIIGNHCFGGTIFLYDGAPDYPTADRMWQVIEHHRITTFGISPTAIRLLMKDSRSSSYDLRSLRLLGSTGEPWDETSWLWYLRNIGEMRCPIVNISGGTEIVGSFVTVLPVQPLKPCSLGQHAPGIATDIVDESGRSVRGQMGYLVCKKPCPSMTRGVWNDRSRYLEAYWSRFPGWWYHGDWASTDDDGTWYVHGRADESMNVAGRKVGPAEVEEALMEHPAVVEAAVIGVPDERKGEGIVAFVVLKADVASDELAAHVVRTMGPTFRPNAIETIPELPKTQSGKVVRRLIREKYLGLPAGDASTVANPGALSAIRTQNATSTAGSGESQ